jgi:hypothetical protein
MTRRPEIPLKTVVERGQHLIVHADARAFVARVIHQALYDTHATESPHADLQLSMARVDYNSERARLLDHTYFTMQNVPTQGRFRTISDSNSNSGAVAWLFALLNGSRGRRITPLEFKAVSIL